MLFLPEVTSYLQYATLGRKIEISAEEEARYLAKDVTSVLQISFMSLRV